MFPAVFWDSPRHLARLVLGLFLQGKCRHLCPSLLPRPAYLQLRQLAEIFGCTENHWRALRRSQRGEGEAQFPSHPHLQVWGRGGSAVTGHSGSVFKERMPCTNKKRRPQGHQLNTPGANCQPIKIDQMKNLVIFLAQVQVPLTVALVAVPPLYQMAKRRA